MTEKVIEIQSLAFQPTKTGKDKWVVATNEGNLSVWDGEMAEQLNKLVGKIANVEIRRPAPNTNYLPTITKIVDAGQVLKEVQNGERSLNGQEQKPGEKELMPIRVDGTYCGNYNKDKSIIAQCLVKAVIGIDNVVMESDVAVENAYRMYKRVLELQE